MEQEGGAKCASRLKDKKGLVTLPSYNWVTNSLKHVVPAVPCGSCHQGMFTGSQAWLILEKKGSTQMCEGRRGNLGASENLPVTWHKREGLGGSALGIHHANTSGLDSGIERFPNTPDVMEVFRDVCHVMSCTFSVCVEGISAPGKEEGGHRRELGCMACFGRGSR